MRAWRLGAESRWTSPEADEVRPPASTSVTTASASTIVVARPKDGTTRTTTAVMVATVGTARMAPERAVSSGAGRCGRQMPIATIVRPTSHSELHAVPTA